MTDTHYFVVRYGDVWMVKSDDEEYGPYHSQSNAVLFAIDAAEKLNAHGETAQVVLMGETGSPSTRLDLRPGHQPKLLVSLAA